MKIKVVIPCHLDSLRLRRKILIDIHGLPMIEHVRRRVLLAKRVDKVIIATGDKEIKNEIEKFGGNVIFTKKNHVNGTSRVNEAISMLDCTHVILVQGDEPLIVPSYIDQFIDLMLKSRDEKMWNAISSFKSNNETFDENKVKCLIDKTGHIISCFRKNPISNLDSKFYEIIHKIQGLIAFEKGTLKKIVETNLEGFSSIESIEQMKAIELGIKIKAIKIPNSLPSVNNDNELNYVKKILLKNDEQIEIFNKIKVGYVR